MMVNKRLRAIFLTLGLTGRHAMVYKTLIGKTKATPLLLARETRLNRSSIYRYLEEMKTSGLVEEILEAHGTSYKASSPENLEMIVNKQEAKLQTLKESVPVLVKELMMIKAGNPAETQIRYFQGLSGLKQMLWNMVKMKQASEFVGYGYLSWNESVGRKYAEYLRQIVVDRNLRDREINNTVGLMEGEPWTDIPNYMRYHEERVLKPEVLDIKHDTYVYGDVFSFYYFYQGELFGVEIHNKEIAKTQKQIFEILWKMAT